jgi:hypothetical protein
MTELCPDPSQFMRDVSTYAAPMPRSTGDDGLDPALDELYAVDPSEFMATRKRLATALRADGAGDAAKIVASARRPTNAAWALNQFARRDPALVDSFLRRSRELQQAQDAALSGKPDELRDATRAQRDALSAATDAAIAVLGDGVTDAYRTQIAATLQAASVDAETAEALRLGRLTREVSGSTGFPDSGSLAISAVSAPKKIGKVAKPTKSATPADAARRARAAAESAAAEESLRSAQDSLATAEESAAATDAHVEALRNELDEARREARIAADAVKEARRELRESQKEVERLRTKGAV